ncbi:hypothetical protein, partial [Salmonella enterica]|uniref:hypothetical protein n=1 Tax=Salmonella enterica TaxID=28901 RepID=UPI001ADAB0A2
VISFRYCDVIHKVNAFGLNLYPELSTNMGQVKVECGKWQCSGKMRCLIASGGDERWKVN